MSVDNDYSQLSFTQVHLRPVYRQTFTFEFPTNTQRSYFYHWCVGVNKSVYLVMRPTLSRDLVEHPSEPLIYHLSHLGDHLVVVQATAVTLEMLEDVKKTMLQAAISQRGRLVGHATGSDEVTLGTWTTPRFSGTGGGRPLI